MKKLGTKLHILYSAGFIFTIHIAFIAYINSSFLSSFVGENFVGLVFIGGAILSMLGLEKISGFLSKFGNYRVMIFLLILEMVALLGLAFLKTVWLIIPIFIIQYTLYVLLRFNFDVFIEHFSKDRSTGSIRGTFLTFVNSAWVISPIIVGFIIANSDSNFWKIYLISSLLILPVLAIIFFNFKGTKDPHYHHPSFWKTLKGVWNNKNVYKITIVNLFLNLFFAWMVIYMPIYLNQHIGFSWDKIGILFTIMLLPYVLFELPLGKLADKFLGEKEFLSIGLAIIAVATATISFIDSKSIVVWAGLLFFTRVGASFVEIMSESYFFKQIGAGDTHIISFFRNNKPIAYILAPLIATIFLLFAPFKFLFLMVGIIIAFGLYYSLTLKDTK